MISEEDFRAEVRRVQYGVLDALTALSPIEDPACVVTGLLRVATSTALLQGNLPQGALRALLDQAINALLDVFEQDGATPREGEGLFVLDHIKERARARQKALMESAKK